MCHKIQNIVTLSCVIKVNCRCCIITMSKYSFLTFDSFALFIVILIIYLNVNIV